MATLTSQLYPGYWDLYLRIVWTETEIDQANNTSTVNITSVQLACPDWNGQAAATGYIEIDGTRTNFNTLNVRTLGSASGFGTVHGITGSKTITHDASGEKTVNLKLYISKFLPNGRITSVAAGPASWNVTLTKIEQPLPPDPPDPPEPPIEVKGGAYIRVGEQIKRYYPIAKINGEIVLCQIKIKNNGVIKNY